MSSVASMASAPAIRELPDPLFSAQTRTRPPSDTRDPRIEALMSAQAMEDKVAEMQEQAKGKEKPTMYTRDQGEKKGDDEDDLL